MSPDLGRKLRASSVEVRAGERGGGSGVIWDSAGLIVTNAHVVRTKKPDVRLADGREFQAEVLKQDRERDLALLRIPADDLEAAAIGDSGRLRAGQVVAAVGNPLGVVGALSVGVIHAVNRDANRSRWIEADVRLAPGNSGGMLADAEGAVIGINTMIYGGLALAVPSNAAAAFVRGDAGSKPMLGIAMREVMAQGKAALVILDVKSGSLAERSGLQLGDVLLLSAAELRAGLDGDREWTLQFRRGKELRQIEIPTCKFATHAGAKAA